MKVVKASSFIGVDSNVARFDCFEEWECRVAVLDANVFRVLFVPQEGLRTPVTWMVPRRGDTDVPWNGRPRLDSTVPGGVRFRVVQNTDSVLIQTSSLTLKVQLRPFKLQWLLPDGQVYAEDRPVAPYIFSHHTRAFAHYMDRHPEDVYHGLGDKTGDLNLHGRRLRTNMTDALGYSPRSGDPLYKHWPFLLTRGAQAGVWYGTFYDNMAPATFDLGCEHSNYYGRYRSYEAPDGDLDMYMILGPKLSDVVREYAALTGAMALGPRWSLGYAATAMPLADAPDAQEQTLQFVGRCKEEGIPCSAFHLGSGYSSIGSKRYVFNWNTNKFPDPSSAMQAMKNLGLRIVANVKPCLLDDHPLYAEAQEQGAFINDKTGSPCTSMFWDGEGAHLDFTNPHTVQWWKHKLGKSLLAVGVDSAWNDNNEYELWDEAGICNGFGSPMYLMLCKPLQPLLMTRASYEAQLEAQPNERVFSVTRAGCPGLQRYAQTWSGDNTTSWATLRYNLRTGLSMSLSGMFNIGHDVGGFAGPVPDPELLLRWFQVGLLHPRFITNSWKECGTVTTPWMHPDVLPQIRWAIKLRYRLMPYLYTLYWRAATLHEPVLRPTAFDFNDDLNCLQENNELMIGATLLGAPVVEAGSTTRQLYLPKGPLGWFDFYSGQWFEAGQTVEVDAPLHRVPLFVPAGGMLPLTADPQDFSRLHDETSRCLRLFPPPAASLTEDEQCAYSFVLYEDDGLSHDYRKPDGSAQLQFTITVSHGEVHLSLKTSGSYCRLPDHIDVDLVCGDERRLVLEAAPGSPELRHAPFVLHEL